MNTARILALHHQLLLLEWDWVYIGLSTFHTSCASIHNPVNRTPFSSAYCDPVPDSKILCVLIALQKYLFQEVIKLQGEDKPIWLLLVLKARTCSSWCAMDVGFWQYTFIPPRLFEKLVLIIHYSVPSSYSVATHQSSWDCVMKFSAFFNMWSFHCHFCLLINTPNRILPIRFRSASLEIYHST